MAARMSASLGAARGSGWIVVRGWAAPLGPDRVVCTGTISSEDDARRALLAAISGAGLVVGVRAGRETADRFLDDLRRLGSVEHVRGREGSGTAAPVRLTVEQHSLLELLGEGLDVGEAASELGLTRRTADRRLAAARRTLGVRSTAEAIVAAIAPNR